MLGQWRRWPQGFQQQSQCWWQQRRHGRACCRQPWHRHNCECGNRANCAAQRGWRCGQHASKRVVGRTNKRWRQRHHRLHRGVPTRRCCNVVGVCRRHIEHNKRNRYWFNQCARVSVSCERTKCGEHQRNVGCFGCSYARHHNYYYFNNHDHNNDDNGSKRRLVVSSDNCNIIHNAANINNSPSDYNNCAQQHVGCIAACASRAINTCRAGVFFVCSCACTAATAVTRSLQQTTSRGRHRALRCLFRAKPVWRGHPHQHQSRAGSVCVSCPQGAGRAHGMVCADGPNHGHQRSFGNPYGAGKSNQFGAPRGGDGNAGLVAKRGCRMAFGLTH